MTGARFKNVTSQPLRYRQEVCGSVVLLSRYLSCRARCHRAGRRTGAAFFRELEGDEAKNKKEKKNNTENKTFPYRSD